MLDWREREEKLLAPWAMHAADSRGRVHAEPLHVHRSPYQRDRDRIVHAAAFRRLAHKTQVFTDYHGDYHRSRLTHTLEVTAIHRSGTLAKTRSMTSSPMKGASATTPRRCGSWNSWRIDTPNFRG
jgi:dGTP triphosphohydrolase